MKALVWAAVCCRNESEGQVSVAPSANGLVNIPTGSQKRLAAGAMPRNEVLVPVYGPFGPEALVTVADWPPLLAMMPATCVPWPLGSTRLLVVRPKTRGLKSGCVASTPESLMFTDRKSTRL